MDSGVVMSQRTVGAPSVVDALRLAATGDERAVAAFITICWPKVVRFAVGRGAEEPEAIAGAVLSEFVARIHRFDFGTDDQLWAYLYRMTRSRVIDEHRRPTPKPVDTDTPNDGDDVELIEFESDVVDRLWVDEVLGALTAEQREVLELRFIEDLSIKETAARTGRTSTSVKAMQRRGLRAAAAALAALAAIAALAYAWSSASDVGYELRQPAPADEGDGVNDGEGGDTSTAEAGELSISDSPAWSSSSIAVRISGDDTVGLGQPLPLAATVLSTADGDAITPDEGRWSVVDGPGAVAFADPGPQTDATFTEAGVYTLRYSAVDDGQEAGQEITITVGDGDGGAVDAPVEVSPTTVLECLGVSGTTAELNELGYHVAIGTSGDDQLVFGRFEQPVFVLAGDGDDTIVGSPYDDVICSHRGNDTINGGDGDDRIGAGADDDVVRAEAGDDRVYGGPGVDNLRGGDGVDEVYGGPGDDTINGGFLADLLFGEEGDDVIDGAGGDDTIRGGDGVNSCRNATTRVDCG